MTNREAIKLQFIWWQIDKEPERPRICSATTKSNVRCGLERKGELYGYPFCRVHLSSVAKWLMGKTFDDTPTAPSPA